MEQGGEGFPAGQQGEPQNHQVAQATQHAEPSPHQPLLHQQEVFPNQQREEMSQLMNFLPNFTYELPLSRIKNIMEANEDVQAGDHTITGNAAAVLGKACELLILDLTHRSWIHTEDNGRRTLQRNDIDSAITSTQIFNFLAKRTLSPDRELR